MSEKNPYVLGRWYKVVESINVIVAFLGCFVLVGVLAIALVGQCSDSAAD